MTCKRRIGYRVSALLLRRLNIVAHFQMNQQTDLLSPNGLRDILWVSGVNREQIRVLNPLCFIAVSITIKQSNNPSYLLHSQLTHSQLSTHPLPTLPSQLDFVRTVILRLCSSLGAIGAYPGATHKKKTPMIAKCMAMAPLQQPYSLNPYGLWPIVRPILYASRQNLRLYSLESRPITHSTYGCGRPSSSNRTGTL